MTFKWYAVRQGYLCGGGNHFITHDMADALLKHGTIPDIEIVNALPFMREVTPPPPRGDGNGDPIFFDAKMRRCSWSLEYTRLRG